jgi:hypothetical protein
LDCGTSSKNSNRLKLAGIVRKKNTIFVVNMKIIMKEEKEIANEVKKLLKEYKDVFSIKSPLDLLPRRDDDEHAISTVPRVKPQIRTLYRLTLKEKKELKIQLKKLIDTGHISYHIVLREC